jgi:hypothetical protein
VRRWAPLEERFFDKIVYCPSGCWVWVGVVSPSQGTIGYGTIKKGTKVLMAHRVSYEIHKGPIPEGYQIDHLCRYTLCVNPYHLEAVTPQENYRRSNSISGRNARKTHCKRGHEFTDENIIRRSWGGRECRACRDEYDARRAAAYVPKERVPRTHCKAGHELVGDNIVWRYNKRGVKAWRLCRICVNAQQNERRVNVA